MKESVFTYGDPEAEVLLLQMVDEHDLEVMEQEVSFLRALSGGKSFCLKAVKVKNWNEDLSPWPAPAVFGKEDFGSGAASTLKFLQEELLPGSAAGSYADHEEPGSKRIYLGGYSLSGLFALWAGCQTDRFAGIAAASPSVWFPGFVDYVKANTMQAAAVYLSLGDREEKTKNPVMAEVGNAIRETYAVLQTAGRDCLLEWNKGNHFKEPALRTAKAFAWLLNRE